MIELASQRYDLFAALASWASLAALYGFLVRLCRGRIVADTPLLKIRSAAQGYVKVVGRASAVGTESVAAPLSSRPCVWWDYAIAQEVRDSRGNKRRETVERATSVDLFLLRDGDAHCLVGPVKAEITASVQKVWYGSSGCPLGPPPAATLFRSGGWRYAERLISDGAQISVMGELRSHSVLGDVAAATAQKLRLWKQDQGTLLARFDANGDGKIDAAEWETVRVAASAESREQALQSTIARISVISAPSDGAPFLIGPQTMGQLERRELRFAALCFGLALLCVIGCAWAIGQARLLAVLGR